MGDDARPWAGSPEGEELFADFLALRAVGEPADIEALCAEHPEHAAELRQLRQLFALVRTRRAPGRRAG